jgi:hypothetical protein
MRVNCIHGYFKFFEEAAGEIARFSETFEMAMVQVEDYFTFETLADAPDYSLVGHPYLNAVGIENFSGPPWEVMRANRLVYDFRYDLVVPIMTIIEAANIQSANNYFYSSSLILPGAIKTLQRVTDYSGFLPADLIRVRYTMVEYDKNY